MADIRVVEVCGVPDEPPLLAKAERLVATFVTFAREMNPHVAAGAALALACFSDPTRAAQLVEDSDSNAVVRLVEIGMSEVEDIIDAIDAAMRLGRLVEGMSDSEVMQLIGDVHRGEGVTRAGVLRSVEETVLERMAK